MESAQSSSNNMQLDDSAQEARWEKQLSELARVETLVQKRKAELQRMDAVLIERRHELEDVVHKRKIAEGRLRRAEEDAGIIEQRAAETSVELIRAGNQLINLEIKGKALSERQEQINKAIEAKGRELKEVETSCGVVRQNVDKLNKEMANKMEELENKESQLKDVESRIQLSLRVEELKQLVAKTETEEKHQAEKYVRALKEGEKALEDKTAQLARTRNELQTQMIQFHELNSKINKLRTELREIQGNVKKGQAEVERLSQRKEEERRIQELNVKEAEQKLVEINNARNESMDALKSHREGFGLLRSKIHESMTKIREYEELKKQKEAEYSKISSLMNEGKAQLENELAQLKSEIQLSEDSLSQVNGALKESTTELETVREELLALKDSKDSVTKELNDLQQTITERRNELIKTNQEIEDVTKEFETAKEKNAEAQARREEMLEKMHIEGEYVKSDNSRKDSLPQESSTPKNHEKEKGPLVTRLQQSIEKLTAENEEQNEALEDARAEVKELKEFMKSERENFQEYLIQMASESNVYRTHLERLHKEYDAEKQRNSRERDLLLSKAQDHRLKARKLSEELSNLKQNHVQTKQELNQLRNTLAKDVKELKEHIEGLTTQIKSELARSLKQVETSKEETSDEFERLRGKKEEMEVQLVTLQQSINTVKTMALTVEKEKTAISKRQKDEALTKEKEVKLQRHQTYLTAQIRQQMSSRAEVLDEERKKAEVSLEGLKSKLKNLEEVISRKDSSVQDFRLKLLSNKVEAEKAADSNKQIDKLRRRLREVEDEKDLIKSQRNHLVSLKEGASLERTTFDYHGELNDRQVKTTSVRSRRSLDSLMNDSFYAKPVKLETELPCRDDVNMNTSLPLQFDDSASLNQHEHVPAPYLSTSRDSKEPRHVAKREMDHGIKDISTTGSRSSESRQKPSLKCNCNSLDVTLGQDSINSSLPMLRKELSSDNGDTGLHTSMFQTEKPLTTERRMEKSTFRPSQGTSSSTFADDRKHEFLSSVHRLKNEKVKELELSLQRLFLT
ncbi:hypothetical protein ACROYT_G004088 [Oculina patagonica]